MDGMVITAAPLAMALSLDRDRTLALTERLAACTHLVSALEYLAGEEDRRPGGVNHWPVTRGTLPARSAAARRAADVVAGRPVTRALHLLRAAAATSLLLPTPPAARLAADVVLSASAALLHPRHALGSDGADHAAFAVQTAAAVARAGTARPAVVDGCLWFVASLGTLAYTASGWTKATRGAWWRGDALTGVVRTRIFGHEAAWRLLRGRPWVARGLGAGVLALECTFPLAYAAGGRPAPLFVGSAALFHLANARVAGLNRFLPAFVALHPAVLYTAGPRDRRGRDGLMEHRDDRFPALLGAGALAGLCLLSSAAWRRRRRVLLGRPGERTLVTARGSALRHRLTGPQDGPGPLVVLVHDVGATAERWEWVTTGLAARHPVLTYQRAGYGGSRRGPWKGCAAESAAADLVDVVRDQAAGRPVVLVAHGLAVHLAWRAAARLGPRLAAVVVLDAARPAPRHSSRRGGDAALRALLRLGMGSLLDDPRAPGPLPGPVRALAHAQFRDLRTWEAAARERRDLVRTAGALARLCVPALILTGEWAGRQAGQAALDDELAAAAPHARRATVAGGCRDEVLADPRTAQRVADLVDAFVAGLGSAHPDLEAPQEAHDRAGPRLVAGAQRPARA